MRQRIEHVGGVHVVAPEVVGDAVECVCGLVTLVAPVVELAVESVGDREVEHDGALRCGIAGGKLQEQPDEVGYRESRSLGQRLGADAWALWVDLDRKMVRIRHYDARMVIPLAWDEDGASECAFVTRAFYRGKAVDQLQMHIRGGMGFSAGSSSSSKSSLGHSDGLLNMESDGTYRIVTVCFDHECNELTPVGVTPVYDTGCAFPTFGIVKPAVMNNRVDMSPYGQSVFAGVVDAMQAVDLTFDALINEVGVSKMRVFLSDVLFYREKNRDKTISIPFGKSDCTVFRKVMSTEDTIQEFAPALRTSSQSEAFRIALQMLGDLATSTKTSPVGTYARQPRSPPTTPRS